MNKGWKQIAGDMLEPKLKHIFAQETSMWWKWYNDRIWYHKKRYDVMKELDRIWYVKYSVLLHWIQTKLSWKPEIVFNKRKRIIWALFCKEKATGVFSF